MKVYVAGHVISEKEEGIVWDILGVFSNPEMAEKVCYDEFCFVGPLRLNEPLPREIIEWPGSYYPWS